MFVYNAILCSFKELLNNCVFVLKQVQFGTLMECMYIFILFSFLENKIFFFSLLS